MSVTDVEQLVRLTRELEEAVPALAGAFPDLEALAEQIARAGERRSVYLLGTIKSGKSTLVNALLGRDVMPRGAGVKTFNLTRARRGEDLEARVRFRSGAQLRALLTFDFRMLGFPVGVPEDPWEAASTAALEQTLTRFEAVCREDERLQAVDADASLLGLLPLSLARVRRIIAGLAQVHAGETTATVAAIARDGELRFARDAFDDYRRWTESPDVAALIREIDLTLPFPAALPQGLELVDCQGSDSLNPLDFADVDSIVQSADLIVYVIQSRLGVRQADRQLLRHLADAGATERLLAVLNVEAFDAMDEASFAALQGRIGADVDANAGVAVPLVAMNALQDLQSDLDDDEVRLMETVWTRREAGAVWERLLAGGAELRRRLAALTDLGAEDRRRALLAGLVQRALTIADHLLQRDRRVLGTDAGGMPRDAVLQAVQRIVEGERERVRADLAHLTDQAFEAAGPLQAELDGFLASGASRYLRQRPVPDALLAETRPARVIDAALSTFNQDWLHAPDSLRADNLRDLHRQVRCRLLQGVRHVLQMLPDAPGTDAQSVVRAADADAPTVREAPEHAMDEILGRYPQAPLLAPVVLPRTLRHGLGAEFMSRALIGRLTHLRSQGDPGDAAEQLARRVEALWRRTLQAAFRQAADDRLHGLPSVRENLKFQYFRPVADALLARLGAEIADGVRAHHETLERLAGAQRLLLRDADRARLQRYRDRLEGAATAR